MSDQHLNFAYSSVATAPSPATSGTSLVLNSGDGALFPAAPFQATIWPTASNPLSSNAEIVRVTVKSTDTLTITRAQEGTSARTVIPGDQIAAGITVKSITDVESPRVQTVTSSATVTPNADTDDMVEITAQAAGLTLANPGGTPVEGQSIVVRLKDNA